MLMVEHVMDHPFPVQALHRRERRPADRRGRATFGTGQTACAWHGELETGQHLEAFTRWHATWNRPREFLRKAFIERIKTRIKEAKEGGESPLSDETLDLRCKNPVYP